MPFAERVEMLPDGEALFDHCNQFAFEGVVSKRRVSGYSSGPSRNWVKTKCPEAGSAAVLSAGGFFNKPEPTGR
jgi:ATP-dependent DNA ligase